MFFLAIIVAWIAFGVNYPLAVLLDDGCVSLQGYLTDGSVQISGATIIIGCIPESDLYNPVDNVYSAAINLANDLANEETIINIVRPGSFVPITTNATAINATYNNIMLGSPVIDSQLAATVAAVGSAPCNGNCGTAQFNSSLANFTLVARAANALSRLSNCGPIQAVLNSINNDICNQLIVGVMLTFVGCIVIGSLLIPAGIISLYVAQKFPERSSAAKLKSRIMVIFVFQFFLSLVALLGEIRTTTAEILVCSFSIAGGLFGFLFLNIPMNKYDWPKAGQVLFSLFVMIIELGILGGWIYIFYIAVVNNIYCTEQITGYSVNLFGIPGSCDQSLYAHSLITAILAGTLMFNALMGSLLALCLGGSIACGTELNLRDSDYGKTFFFLHVIVASLKVCLQ